MNKALLFICLFVSIQAIAAVQQGNSLVFTINEFYEADKDSFSAEERILFKLNQKLENMNLKISNLSVQAPQLLCSAIKDYDSNSPHCVELVQNLAFSCILKNYQHPVSVFFKKAQIKNADVDRDKKITLTVDEITGFYESYQSNLFSCLLTAYGENNKSLIKPEINKIINTLQLNPMPNNHLNQSKSIITLTKEILGAYGNFVRGLACREKNIQQCTNYDNKTCAIVFNKYALKCAGKLKQKIPIYASSNIDGFEMLYEDVLRCEISLYAKEYQSKLKKKQMKCLEHVFSQVVEMGVKRTLGLIR